MSTKPSQARTKVGGRKLAAGLMALWIVAASATLLGLLYGRTCSQTVLEALPFCTAMR